MRIKFSRVEFGVMAFQFVLVGKGDGVHEEVHRAPLLLDFRKYGVNRGNILDVAGHHERRARLLSQRLHALGQRVTLIGKGEFCAVLSECLRYPPGDRVVVGDPYDQPAFALHQPRHSRPFRHRARLAPDILRSSSRFSTQRRGWPGRAPAMRSPTILDTSSIKRPTA